MNTFDDSKVTARRLNPYSTGNEVVGFTKVTEAT